MMYLQNKHDAAHFIRNDAMFALMCRRHTSFGIAVIIGEASIICRQANIIEKKKPPSEDDGFSFRGDPYGNRTHVSAVKGRCLDRLTNGP